MPKKRLSIPVLEIEKVYYSSRSHTQASNILSKKYGLTSRAFRYRLRKLEETGFLSYESLKLTKTRDILKIQEMRKKTKKERVREVGEVMLTVWWKIKYERIGSKGFHPFYMEGFFSRKVPRDYAMSEVYDMMNVVQERLSEYRELKSYLEINKEKYEEGIEIEELSETRKRDGEFKYNYGRKEQDARM